jgi:hypothetical protein
VLMTRDRHALPTAGFRLALAKRASGEGPPGASGPRPERKSSAATRHARATTRSRHSGLGRCRLRLARRRTAPRCRPSGRAEVGPSQVVATLRLATLRLATLRLAPFRSASVRVAVAQVGPDQGGPAQVGPLHVGVAGRPRAGRPRSGWPGQVGPPRRGRNAESGTRLGTRFSEFGDPWRSTTSDTQRPGSLSGRTSIERTRHSRSALPDRALVKPDTCRLVRGPVPVRRTV